MPVQTAWPRATKGLGRSLTPQQQLACLLRALAANGWAENVAGHITVALPGADEYLVNPWGIWWEEVTASDMMRVDGDGNVLEGRWDVTPAIHIHTEIHRRRADAVVVVHNHPWYATALGVLGRTPEFLHQNFCAFDGSIRLVDEYSGTVNNAEEGDWLAQQVGGATAILLRNHGAVVTAPDVRVALWKSVMFERMCRMSYELPLHGTPREVPPEQRTAIKAQLERNVPDSFWEGAVRQLLATEPEVLD
jgi:ribulose-5-phosphate 4-epimerase/fuculose-1-phosphate aldolase